MSVNFAIFGLDFVAHLWVGFRSRLVVSVIRRSVAITAPCAFVVSWAAAVVGSIAVMLAFDSTYFVEERMRSDDPCDQRARGPRNVRSLGRGYISNGSYGGGWNGSDSTGVSGLIDGDFDQFGAQLLGAVTILIVNFTLSYKFSKSRTD